MSVSIDAENLIEELEEITNEIVEDQNDGIIEEISTGECLGIVDEAHLTTEPKSGTTLDVNLVNTPNTLEPVSIPEQEMAHCNEVKGQSSITVIHSEDGTQSSNTDASTLVSIVGEPEGCEDAAAVDSSETMSASNSPIVPEIVPNSETHVRHIIRDDDCSIVSTGSTDQNHELDTLHSVISIKEEEDEEAASHLEETEVTFNVSPSFEASLDPKYKPTIRLQKINITSDSMKMETEVQESDDEGTNDDSTTLRPKRSIKTPSHLAGSFVLDPKDTIIRPNTKTLQKTQASEQSKTPKSSTVTNKSTASKAVKVIKNFIPIRPKPAGSGSDKSPTVTMIKSNKTPLAQKSVPSEAAKEIVRNLNADSVPTILKRNPKRKSDDADKLDSSISSLKVGSAKKAKVEPPKKLTRKHKKVFDYESYLRDHLETEVKDKKPQSTQSNGESLHLLSSLVGVNVAPSTIKVIPFNTTKVLKKTNENETNNVVRTGERTLYDMMQDLSRLLPSWNLHVLPDSNSFCIAQVCRGRSGIPILKTSIELDEHFNAKVFIHQLHCKRYDGIYDSEESISALIQEIDTLSK